MSLKREIDKTRKNVRDAVDEAGHRTAAEAERLDRETDPGTMTPGDHARSVMNETKHKVQADIDKAKRVVRNKT